MGDFRITINGTGNHGCQREAKAGETLAVNCGNAWCVDCKTRAFLEDLKSGGAASIQDATLEHWPKWGERRPDGTIGRPKDDLITNVRVVPFNAGLEPATPVMDPDPSASPAEPAHEPVEEGADPEHAFPGSGDPGETTPVTEPEPDPERTIRHGE